MINHALNNTKLVFVPVAYLSKDVHRCEDGKKFKCPDGTLDSTHRHKMAWHGHIRIFMLENAIENFRIHFNVASLTLMVIE